MTFRVCREEGQEFRVTEKPTYKAQKQPILFEKPRRFLAIKVLCCKRQTLRKMTDVVHILCCRKARTDNMQDRKTEFEIDCFG